VNDLPLWCALAVIWLLAFLAGILLITRLNQLGLICFLDIALTIILLAIVGFLRSLAPYAHGPNSELIFIFIIIGLLALVTFLCLLALEIGGIRL
jgi:hypothetical protein